MNLKLQSVFTILCLLVSTPLLTAQTNLSLVGSLDLGDNLSDIWGYTYTAPQEEPVEYAIVGLHNGTSIVSLADPSNPEQVAYVAGANTTWRDMKVWDHYAYIINEGAGGLLIIDMANLPNGIETYYWTGENDANYDVFLDTAHNIFIDEQGYAYIVGANYGAGGAIILDLTADPINPPIIGIYDDNYVHDIFVRDNIMYTAELFSGIKVVDISNPANPVIIGEGTTPTAFAHNCWLSDDDNTLYTTDEVTGGYLGALDVSDFSDIQEVDRTQSSPGSGVIPHNTFVVGNFLVTSYYRDGVTIHDINNPHMMIEVGNYDTSIDYEGDGFNGSWGVYPYFPSGLIAASDIETGLYILQPTYQQACYLSGIITDVTTGMPIVGATVSIIDENGATVDTDFSGIYTTGVALSGSYTINVFEPGYAPFSVTVNLENGVTFEQDINLEPLPAFALSGNIIDGETGAPVTGAMVSISNADISFPTTTDADGNFVLSDVFADTYDIVVGLWGYETQVINGVSIDEGFTDTNITLTPGYSDNFMLDLGWTVTNEALGANATGAWERGEPIGTTINTGYANPEVDVATDIGDQCYVTGNAGGGVGNDDVDALVTTLTSPVFDVTTLNTPTLLYYRWFFNGGGTGTPNDELRVTIDNGTETATIEVLDVSYPFMGQWQLNQINIANYITPTSTMRVSFQTADSPNSGHLVEAAVDAFQVYDANPSVGINTVATNMPSLSISPNPCTNQTTISLQNMEQYLQNNTSVEIQISNIFGQCVYEQVCTGTTLNFNRQQLPNGMYQVTMATAKGEILHNEKLLLK